jgi:hypothetical protein
MYSRRGVHNDQVRAPAHLQFIVDASHRFGRQGTGHKSLRSFHETQASKGQAVDPKPVPVDMVVTRAVQVHADGAAADAVFRPQFGPGVGFREAIA